MPRATAFNLGTGGRRKPIFVASLPTIVSEHEGDRRQRARERHRDRRVVVLLGAFGPGFDENKVTLRALALGVWGYVPKSAVKTLAAWDYRV